MPHISRGCLVVLQVHARSNGYTLDPHSAIGVAAARKVGAPVGSSGVPMVCLACAHWAKFPDANAKALGADAARVLVVPEPLASPVCSADSNSAIKATSSSAQVNNA